MEERGFFDIYSPIIHEDNHPSNFNEDQHSHRDEVQCSPHSHHDVENFVTAEEERIYDTKLAISWPWCAQIAQDCIIYTKLCISPIITLGILSHLESYDRMLLSELIRKLINVELIWYTTWQFPSIHHSVAILIHITIMVQQILLSLHDYELTY